MASAPRFVGRSVAVVPWPAGGVDPDGGGDWPDAAKPVASSAVRIAMARLCIVRPPAACVCDAADVSSHAIIGPDATPAAGPAYAVRD